MKLLYLGYLSSAEIFQNIEDAGLDPSRARQNYEVELINCIANNELLKREDCTIISYLPQNEKIKNCRTEDEAAGIKVQYVWTSRTNPVKIVMAMRKIGARIRRWMQETEHQERVILTYAANPILLLPAFLIKKRVRIVTIVSEVPQYRNLTEGNPLVNQVKKIVFSFFNNRMDGYVYMTKHMNEVCNPKKKPWIVVEGMTRIPELIVHPKKTWPPVIFYAGGIHKENGIDVLLEAFERMQNKQVSLHLCGIGNVVDQVNAYAAKNDRITYFGTLTNDRVRQMESEASLLINPRKSDLKLTRYSFPSKTFEYFSSGTPCVLTHLAGIPDEFYQYCYTCDARNADTLAADLDRILEIPACEREILGAKAYRFLWEEKSPEKQTKKIVSFLCELLRS